MVRLTEEMVAARTRMSDCTAVKKLNCWGTELTDVSILRKMRNVEILSLSVNNISSLKDFQNCVDLKDLFVRKNNIRDLNEVCYLQALSKLRNLWLGENPCAEIDGYRLSIIKTLPHLEKLDDKIVTPEEVQTAMVRGRSLIHPLNLIHAESSLPSSPCGTPELSMTKYFEEQDIDQSQNYSSSDEQRSYQNTNALDSYQETDKRNANYNTSSVHHRQYPFNTRYSYENSNDKTALRHNGDYDNLNQRMYTPISPRTHNPLLEYNDERGIEYDDSQRSMSEQSKREVINQNIDRILIKLLIGQGALRNINADHNFSFKKDQ
ncbi:PREDICTED: protein C21orf2 homolog isoform X2 [Ceratosolen solmsi marchali]|uniref:Protein C21orf2 homolog isoform X2 n=1 Tax=Ceratosolen solmsi marchali TaxID=326594 RepID=A0AAJ6YS66_9HYME|nr:PREDICTED: protein C21orf2 homolog isoform X2 [Ceratosolen solmsi marchali]